MGHRKGIREATAAHDSFVTEAPGITAQPFCSLSEEIPCPRTTGLSHSLCLGGQLPHDHTNPSPLPRKEQMLFLLSAHCLD